MNYGFDSLQANYGATGSYLDHLGYFFTHALPAALGIRAPFTGSWIIGTGHLFLYAIVLGLLALSVWLGLRERSLAAIGMLTLPVPVRAQSRWHRTSTAISSGTVATSTSSLRSSRSQSRVWRGRSRLRAFSRWHWRCQRFGDSPGSTTSATPLAADRRSTVWSLTLERERSSRGVLQLLGFVAPHVRER